VRSSFENQLNIFSEVNVLVVEPANHSCQHFRCQSSGHCIFRRYRCNRFINCHDASDELGCGM